MKIKVLQIYEKEIQLFEIIKNLFGGQGNILQGAKEIIDEVITNKEEKAILELKLKEMLQQHEQFMVKAVNDDRHSARIRESEIIKAGTRNITQNILAYVGVISFFAITGYILSKGLGQMSTEESFLIGNLTGMAGAICKDIMGYYFGSSKGEREYKNFIKKSE